MKSLDPTLANIIVSSLIALVGIMGFIVVLLWRRNTRLQDNRIKDADLASKRAELRATNSETTAIEKIKAMQSEIELSLKLSKLEGKIEGFEMVVKSFGDLAIKQVKDHALGQVRTEMNKTIKSEFANMHAAMQATPRPGRHGHTPPRETYPRSEHPTGNHRALRDPRFPPLDTPIKPSPPVRADSTSQSSLYPIPQPNAPDASERKGHDDES